MASSKGQIVSWPPADETLHNIATGIRGYVDWSVKGCKVIQPATIVAAASDEVIE
jgi:hypothetical protein